ncbi:polysaccharide pyruvyl transferase family protein [Geobacillus thermoleovorans]|uniref:polysaccharide pyruvyl transferase family protein n=2 Tax=Geobacillus thermoleovorans TaxID=33941 RepID=UPI0016801E00|nr:polysaccharide pyruvyl transferase family protein [Geobacillus thermoleovorans]QNU20462.1 polysaccharide pyruvyl transferase family protein [Geobacillus thermoleovorans]
MKKVMIYAYTNFNLGDDLFIKILCERYPQTQFVLYAPGNYKKCFREINNLKILSSDSLGVRGFNFILRNLKIHPSFFRSLVAKNCDAAVYIGGSLFIQGKNWRNQIENLRSMRIDKKPFFLLGANFGPFTNMDFYLQHKEIFKGFTDICFREKYSYSLFEDLPNVRVASDIVFQLRRENIHRQTKNQVIISVIKPSIREYLSGYNEVYYRKIKDIAIYFIKKGYDVILMSFCKNEGDSEAVKNIMKLIPKEYLDKVIEYSYQLNIDKALDVIAGSSFVVATRFHAMILGWVYNKPVFPIAYSNKMINVMKDVGFKGSYVDFNDLNSLEPEEVFRSMESNFVDISQQIKSSEKQFQKLDEYLYT